MLSDNRAISPVVASAILIVIVVVITATAAVLFMGTTDNLSDAPDRLSVTVDEKRNYAQISVDQAAKRTNNSLLVKVNGDTVTTWQDYTVGTSKTLYCLKPGDTIQIVSQSADSSYVVEEHEMQEQTACKFMVEQGDEQFVVSPINWRGGDKKASEFYSYGWEDGTGHPHTHMDDQFMDSDTSYAFFYKYNDEVSLVLVHDKPDSHGGHSGITAVQGDEYTSSDTQGGKVTFTIYDLPEDGSWAVRDDDPGNDDYACNPPSDATRVCWRWGQQHTDGGVYSGGFGGDASNANLTIQPDKWENIDKWAFVTGTEDNPKEITLDMNKNFSIKSVNQTVLNDDTKG